MTIGELIDKLQPAKSDVIVKFDFGGTSPTKICSWRGNYAEASLEFTDGTYGSHYTTVEELLAELNAAISNRVTFSGWKGGDYHYCRETQLHIDNHGNCTNTEIEQIEVDEWQVVIHTRYEP